MLSFEHEKRFITSGPAWPARNHTLNIRSALGSSTLSVKQHTETYIITKTVMKNNKWDGCIVRYLYILLASCLLAWTPENALKKGLLYDKTNWLSLSE